MGALARASSVGLLSTYERDGAGARAAEHANEVMKDMLVIARPVMPLASFFRVDRIARFVDVDAAIYPLGAIPPNATWGTGSLADMLTVDGVGTEAWVLGTIERIWFEASISERTTVSVTLRLLRECDRTRMVKLLRRSSPKTRCADIDSDSLTSTVTVATGTTFRGFYDATEKYRAPAVMTTVGINDLIPGDVVLLQCALRRDMQAPQSAQWTVGFELRALSLLYAHPRATAPDVHTQTSIEL
ncbi:hypothetical protein K466DRAFT_596204 [Polyporus arcularius HHB13444]|uniref:Uncharacterized protein n=1 Tax=Polyporus arcularius HHB13444 TaxID=1314778 RepID=A0A5C3PSM2_9APHY|nr:hypothetical protein K466DRAFT_596204 [Polyporus arcularius HHB13444]